MAKSSSPAVRLLVDAFDGQHVELETLSSSSSFWCSSVLRMELRFLFARWCARVAHRDLRFPTVSAEFGLNPTAAHLARGVPHDQITVVVGSE